MRSGNEGGLCEEVPVLAFAAGEAGREVERRSGAPGEDFDVRGEEAVEQGDIRELVLDGIEVEIIFIVLVFCFLI